MVVKSKLKSKSRSSRTASKSKSKPQSRSSRTASRSKSKTGSRVAKVGRPRKLAYKKKSAAKKIDKSKNKTRSAAKAVTKGKSTIPPRSFVDKPAFKPVDKYELRPVPAFRASTSLANRAHSPLVDRRPVPPRTPRIHQFNYMKAPGTEHAFDVGDTVEVFCDHEKNRERIRGWVKGIVVQVDNKLVAVQFRSNVFLTDGWMVPDRILWYPLNSEHIRPMPGKKPATKDFLPEY